MTTRRPPAGLKQRGKRLWTWATTTFDLSPAEEELLLEASRTLDLLDVLQARAQRSREPAVLVELRLSRETFCRLLQRLDFPEQEAPPSLTTLRARRAARSRWAHHVKREDA